MYLLNLLLFSLPRLFTTSTRCWVPVGFPAGFPGESLWSQDRDAIPALLAADGASLEAAAEHRRVGGLVGELTAMNNDIGMYNNHEKLLVDGGLSSGANASIFFGGTPARYN